MWFDPVVVERVGELLPTWLAVLMVVLSYLGSVYLIAPAAVAAYWRWRDLVAPMLGGIVGCYGLMSITKSYHTASRPTVDPPIGAEVFPLPLVPLFEHAAHIDTTSFPSGHALAATIIVGMLVVELPVSSLPKRALVGAGVVGWVGLTRVGLGVHYPGDVVGGVAYGLAFLALFYLARRLLTRHPSVDAPTAAFAVGLAVGTVALAYVGSRNAHVVFGAGLGGLLAWRVAPAAADRLGDSVWGYVLPLVGVVAVGLTWVVTELGIGGNTFLVAWSALFLVAIVLVPWVRTVRYTGQLEHHHAD